MPRFLVYTDDEIARMYAPYADILSGNGGRFLSYRTTDQVLLWEEATANLWLPEPSELRMRYESQGQVVFTYGGPVHLNNPLTGIVPGEWEVAWDLLTWEQVKFLNDTYTAGMPLKMVPDPLGQLTVAVISQPPSVKLVQAALGHEQAFSARIQLSVLDVKQFGLLPLYSQELSGNIPGLLGVELSGQASPYTNGFYKGSMSINGGFWPVQGTIAIGFWRENRQEELMATYGGRVFRINHEVSHTGLPHQSLPGFLQDYSVGVLVIGYSPDGVYPTVAMLGPGEKSLVLELGRLDPFPIQDLSVTGTAAWRLIGGRVSWPHIYHKGLVTRLLDQLLEESAVWG